MSSDTQEAYQEGFRDGRREGFEDGALMERLRAEKQYELDGRHIKALEDEIERLKRPL